MSCSAMLRRPVRFWQDAEKVRQRRSRKTRPPHRLGGVHKRDARYSARREPQRLTVRPEYDSPLRSLRPCWTAFLRSLRPILTSTQRVS